MFNMTSRLVVAFAAGCALLGQACGSAPSDDESVGAGADAITSEGRFNEERDRARASTPPPAQGTESQHAGDAAVEKAVPWSLAAPVDRRWIGGNLLEEDHYWTVGGPCDPGFVRAQRESGDPATEPNPKVVKLSGNGACDFAGWENPTDTSDCRARIHAHTNAGWGNVVCETSVFEMRARKSCCDAHNSPGCDERANGRSISQCVCAQDSFCCNTTWDEFCASEVERFGCAPRNFCG